jgi:hypothetical protein
MGLFRRLIERRARAWDNAVAAKKQIEDAQKEQDANGHLHEGQVAFWLAPCDKLTRGMLRKVLEPEVFARLIFDQNMVVYIAEAKKWPDRMSWIRIPSR